jgi:hypothetical protein
VKIKTEKSGYREDSESDPTTVAETVSGENYYGEYVDFDVPWSEIDYI